MKFQGFKGIRKSKQSSIRSGQTLLHVKGKFKATLRATVNGQEKLPQDEIYVVQGLGQALLGQHAIEKLSLITRSSEGLVTGHPANKVRAKYPKIFSGLGKLKSNYSIQLKQNATPFSLTTPRSFNTITSQS
mgnify:CR=1 FL=1